MANVSFQSRRLATPASGTTVAAYDRDGVLYQRFMQGFDYTLFYYDASGNIEYICKHDVHGTATSAADWLIMKLTYSSGNISKKEILEGSVDNRATLGWT